MTGIIKSALGLLVNKGRDVVASKLSEGDVADENLRGVFIREINEIKGKLDGLAGQYLLSSHSFLREGLTRLEMAVQKKSTNSNTPTTSQNVQAITSPALGELTAVDGASTSQQRLNTAFTIPNAVARELKVVSLERFVNAKESFKESRKQATQAFNNVSLSIDDRIMASKYRIVSRMLESFLEDPDAGARDCLLYLEELHSLPAIREIFSVYRGGGVKSYFKSFFNEEERRRKVETIDSINTVVFDFIAGFTTLKFYHGVHWPTIQLRNKKEHIFYSKRNITNRQKQLAELNEFRRMEARWPNIKSGYNRSHAQVKDWHWLENERLSETLFLCGRFVQNLRGKTHRLEFEEPMLVNMFSECVVKNALCVATDASFWLYILTYVRDSSSPKSSLVLIHVFDSHRKFLKDIGVSHFSGSHFSEIGAFAMHVRHELQHKIAVLHEKYDCRRVNFINFSTGQTYHTITLPPQFRNFPPFQYLSFLNENDIMVTRSCDKALQIYTDEGQLKETIQLPVEKQYYVCGVAFNAVSEEILVLTSVSQDGSREEKLLGCRLLVYSTTGALQDSYGLSGSLFGHNSVFVNCSRRGLALVGIDDNEIKMC